MADTTIGSYGIEVFADTSKVASGAAPGIKTLKELGEAADAAGRKAADALKTTNEAGAQTGDKISASARNMLAQVQRLTAEQIAGGKANEKYLSTMMDIRKFSETDRKSLDPLIQNLSNVRKANEDVAAATRLRAEAEKFAADITERANNIGKTASERFADRAKALGMSEELGPAIAKIREAEQSMAGLGRSAKDTALAMRFVAPQITDIVTSLASGQNAAVVFLQQGGQLKDMFGGVGAAARAAGTYIMSMVNPLTVAAAVAAALALAFKQGRDEIEEFRKSMILSGNAAGATVSGMQNAAKAISSVVGTQHAAAAAIAELAGSTRIGAQNFTLLGEAAVRMDRVLGQSVADTRKEFEELGKSPLEAISKLNDKYGFLTNSVVAQIAALENQGKTAQAAQVAQVAYADAMIGKTKQLEENLGLLSKTWLAIKDAAKAAWDAMLNMGRAPSTADALSAARTRLEELQGRADTAAAMLPGGAAKRKAREDVAAAAALVDNLAEQLRLETRLGSAQADRVAAGKAGVEVEKLIAKYMADQKKEAKEIAEATEQFRISGRLATAEGQKQLAEVVAGIRKSHAKTEKVDTKPLEAYKQVIGDLIQIEDKLIAKEEHLTETQKALQKAVDTGAWATMNPAMQHDVLLAAEISQRMEEQAQGEENALELAKQRSAERTKENEEIDKYLKKQAEERQKAVDSAKEELKAAEDKTNAQSNLKSAIQDTIVLRLQERLALATEGSKLARMLKEEIEIRQRLAGVFRSGEARQANEEAAKKALSEWERTADQVSQSLANALMSGGKSAGEYIRNFFKSMVLTPTLKAIISPMTMALGGALGFGPGAAGAAAGAGTASNAFGLAGIAGAFNGGYDRLYTQFSGSSFGQALGLSRVQDASTAMYTEAVADNTAVMTGLGKMVGEFLPYLTSLAQLANGNIASAALSAIGTAIAGPFGTVVGSILGSFFDKSGGGPKGGGSFSTTGERLFTPSDYDPLTEAIGTAIVRNAQTIATSLGGSLGGATVSLGFDTDPFGRAENRIASRVISALGVTTLDNSAGRNIGRDPEKITSELATESKRVLLAALQAADIGNGWTEILKRLDPATAAPDAIDNLLEFVNALHAFMAAMRDMPGALGKISSLSATAVDQLANAAGGLDKLQANLKSYYENFFTPQEKQQSLTARLSRDLNDVGLGPDLTLPAGEIKAWFKSTVEEIGQTIDTVAGANKFAAVTALSQEVADWASATEDLASAAKDVTDALEKQRLETQRDSLQGQVDSMTAKWGDLSKSLQELEHPTETVADKFMRLGQEISDMETAINDALGGGAKTLTERLAAATSERDSLVGVRGNIRDAINATILQGFVDRGDRAGANSFIKTQIDWLTAHINENPADYASRILDLIQNRAKINQEFANGDAQKAIDDAKDILNLEKESRETRKQGLRDEIDRLKELASALEDIKKTIVDLKTGDLSALPPSVQLAVQGESYAQVLAMARAGDPKALAKISGAGTAYLQEARSFYGSGGNYAGTFSAVTGDLESLATQLGDVPTLLSTAEEQLKVLEKIKDAVSDPATPVVDLSTETTTALTNLDTTVGTALDDKKTEIGTLVDNIQDDINDRKAERLVINGRWLTAQNDIGALKTSIANIETALLNLEKKVTLATA